MLEQPVVGQSEAPCLSPGRAVDASGKGIMLLDFFGLFFQPSAVHRFPELPVVPL